MDQFCAWKEGRQQPQVQVVLRHLVHDAKGRGTSRAKFLQVPCGNAASGLTVQPAQTLDGGQTFATQRGKAVASQRGLARAEDLGMAGQDLLDERRAGARQPHDEHRQFALQAEAAHALKERRTANLDQPRDERVVSRRIVLLAVPAPLRELQGVAPGEVFGGLGIVAQRVEDLRHTEV